MAVAAAIGAIAGFVVYTASRVTGRNLYLIIGAVAAAVAVFVLQQYWRTAQLTEVKISVPQVSEPAFVVNNDARQWRGSSISRLLPGYPRSRSRTRADSSARL